MSKFIVVLLAIALGGYGLHRLSRISAKDEAPTQDEALRVLEEVERQRHEIAFAELALAEKEKQIDEMFERLEAAKVFARNARRLQEIAARRFEELFHGIPIACFTCDSLGVVFDCSRSAESLWGVTSHEAMERTIFQLMANGIDNPKLHELLSRATSGETVESEEFEILNASQEVRWVLGHVFPMYGAEGEITGSVWALVDDTERKQQANRLQESETRLRTSLESMQSGVMIFDASGSLQVSNPRATEILGWDSDNLTEWNDRYGRLKAIHRDGRPVETNEMPLFRSLGGETCHDLTLGIKRPDESLVWISVNAAPMIAQTGTVGAVVSFVDISQKLAYEVTIHETLEQVQHYSSKLELQTVELEEANLKLEALASTDGLTGLKNQRSYREFLDTQFINATRYGHELSLLTLDVDYFKAYNDDFGHPAGDVVLKKLAEILSREARAGDFVARSGGEEFATILSHTGEAGAMEAAERIRSAIETAEWPLRGVTASIGVATISPALTSQDDLIRAADQAMYFSKRNGRNRATQASELDSAA